MHIIVSDLSYHYTNRQSLFEAIRFSVPPGGKAAVVGNNGTGKSTLLKLLAGELTPASGCVACTAPACYVPQQPDLAGLSVAGALGVAEKRAALHAICAGSTDPAHYDALGDDWDIESKCRAALDGWGLHHVGPDSPADALSGGEKTKLLLAGATLCQPEILLLDEPTNHLDEAGRRQLYAFVRDTRATVVVVSHDITLLNLLETIYELSPLGLKRYGGNYDFYRQQKQIERQALEQHLDAAQSALKLARRRAQEVRERQEKRVAQGEKNKDQAPRILRKGLKDSGERTASRLRDQHAEIIGRDREKIAGLRAMQQRECLLRIDFDDAQLHDGKLLAEFRGVNFAYPGGTPLWEGPLDATIRSGERIRLRGGNGTGKTTLVKLLTGELQPTAGEIRRNGFSYVYLDQEYSRLDTPATVLEAAQACNHNHLEDHELKMRLHRALFPAEAWDKACDTLSGGERMRLSLCCLMIENHVPDLFILDEPTNNLDLQSLGILTDTIRSYRGTVLLISHDSRFAEEVGITRTISL